MTDAQAAAKLRQMDTVSLFQISVIVIFAETLSERPQSYAMMDCKLMGWAAVLTVCQFYLLGAAQGGAQLPKMIAIWSILFRQLLRIVKTTI